MIKVKHERTADCAGSAGFRWHKQGAGTMIGSLLLGLYDDDRTLHHVGVAAAFTAAVREQLVVELAPLRAKALEDHPWRDWGAARRGSQRQGTAAARCGQPVEPRKRSEAGRRCDRSASVRSHTITCRGRGSDMPRGSLRWRPDKRPQDCRYDQLEVTPAYELDRVFGARR